VVVAIDALGIVPVVDGDLEGTAALPLCQGAGFGAFVIRAVVHKVEAMVPGPARVHAESSGAIEHLGIEGLGRGETCGAPVIGIGAAVDLGMGLGAEQAARVAEGAKDHVHVIDLLLNLFDRFPG
jgi:hypothetical protein